MSYHLYILRCSDDSLYTGIATDVSRRIAEHESGMRGAKYLRGRLPVELVFQCDVGDRGTALRLEYRVKRMTRATKEALIAGRIPIDPDVQASGVSSG